MTVADPARAGAKTATGASLWSVLANRRMLICAGLGFASGLPLFLLVQLVPAWLRMEGVSLTAIGFFTAIQYPYTLKSAICSAE